MTVISSDRVSPLRELLLRDRLTILVALAGVTGLSWLYLWRLASQMTVGSGMAGMAMTAAPKPWEATDFALMFVMWWVMMVGMMLPSATPMLLTFATINRRRRARCDTFVPTAVFAAGYLASWGGFGLAATVIQWALGRAGLVSPMAQTTSPFLAAAFFVAAGLFQLTPLKHACLEKCRSPLDLVLNSWRDGSRGAFVMGLSHGLYCIGCCWLLMVLMFAGGAMNLLWMAAITAVVFVEKLVPGGPWFARGSGIVMVAFGVYSIVQA
jgi:predicted metal-binding membrane protein